MRSARPESSVRPMAVALGAAWLIAASGASAQPAANPVEGSASTTLELAPRKLDPEGSRAAGMMYMPSSAEVKAEKPAGVTKEPEYRAEPKYATVTLGTGTPSTFVIAFDEPEAEDAKVYPDLNGNGDLTDDATGAGETGAWEKKTESEGKSPQYSGTFVFNVRWKGEDGKETTGGYGLNFYRSPDRDAVNYYRAGARTGSITVGGKEYEVTLIENDNDARFDKLYDPSKPQAVGEMTKPVWLALDGDRFDIRATFGFADMNYVAKVSDDGSKLTLTPTMKVIKLPRPAERPAMLGAGKDAPDFEAVLWTGDAKAEPKTFKLSDYEGKKIVVLDLWATWCGPCMAGIPHLSKIAEATKGQGVEVIALNVYDEKAPFEKFASTKGKQYAFTLARDPAGKEADASIAKRLFSVSSIPATYVIDKSGKIVAAVSGYTAGDKEIETALRGLGVKIE